MSSDRVGRKRPPRQLKGADAERFEARREVVQRQLRGLERARRMRTGEPLLRLHRDQAA